MSDSARALRGSMLLAAAVVVADQLTKHWALNALDDRDIDLFWTLRFNLVFNQGMAFSQAEGLGPIIGVVALVVVVGLLVSLRRGAGTLGAVGVGLVVGGALGNVIDRLFRGEGWFRGAVVDFIDFQWFPVFNIADISINVGAGLLILGSIRTSRREAAEAAAAESAEAADDTEGAEPDEDVARDVTGERPS
jgi:signal peptidase II